MMKHVLYIILTCSQAVTAIQNINTRKNLGLRGSDPIDFLYCTPEDNVKIDATTLQYSNIGGMSGGVDKSMPHSMYFSDVLPATRQVIDMMVTAASKYYNGAHENTVHGELARLGLAAGSNVTLNYAFRMHHGDEMVPFAGSSTMFTILDAKGEGVEAKSVKVCGHDIFQMAPDTIIEVVSGGAEGDECVELRWPPSNAALDELPKHILALDDRNLRGAVSFIFTTKSEFEITYHVEPGASSGQFMWGSQSNVICEKRAMCDTYTCPKFFILHDHAKDLYCKYGECSDAGDRNTCCQIHVPETCEPDVTMLFAPGSLKWSNFAGLGPDLRMPDAMVYRNVFPGRVQDIDLWVTAASTYTPTNVTWNGQFGSFGSLNVRAGTSVDVLFEFRRGDQKLEAGDIDFAFYFSVLDFDMTSHGGVEQVSVDDLYLYELTEDTKIDVQKEVFPNGHNRTTFTARELGNSTNNPSDPLNLTTDQLSRSVTLEFLPTHEFSLSFAVHAGPESSDDEGRNFMFAGWTPTTCSEDLLCFEFQCPEGKRLRSEDQILQCEGDECNQYDEERCCESIPVDACAWENTLEFKGGSLLLDNLGRQGPQEGAPPIMFFSNVHQGLYSEGFPIDMVFFAMASYDPGNVTINQVDGGIITIGLSEGSSLLLRVRFIDRNTQRLVSLKAFYLTILDLVSARNGYEEESVSVYGYKSVNYTSDTTLQFQDQEDGSVRVSGTEPDEGGPPSNPLSLTPKQRRRSTTLFFEKVDTIDLVLKATRDKNDFSTPATFRFAGRSDNVCPTPTACSSMTCPQNMMLVPQAETVSCRDEACLVSECCVPDYKDECTLEKMMSFSEAGVNFSNLAGTGPDQHAEEALMFSNMFPHSNQMFDLKITALTEYSGDTSKNALSGIAGAISINNGTSTKFKFQLVPRTSDENISMVMPFWMTFLDIVHEATDETLTSSDMDDMGPATDRHMATKRKGRNRLSDESRGDVGDEEPTTDHHMATKRSGRNRFAWELEGGRMWLSTSDAVASAVHELSSLTKFDSATTGGLRITAGMFGVPGVLEGPAPNPFTLTQFDKATAVALKFNTTEFEITLGVETRTLFPKAFKFTGSTNLVCPARSTCQNYACPAQYKARPSNHEELCRGAVCTVIDRDICCELEVCSPERELQFQPESLKVSNLGGDGPDNDTSEALIFENVFPLQNRSAVNLIVRNLPKNCNGITTKYFPHNASQNGLQGAFGQINLLAGSAATFKFEFVENATGLQVDVPPFLFSLLDIDQQHEDGQETVNVSDYIFMATTPHSDLEILENGGGAVRSAIYGNAEDNPTNPRKLTPSQLNRTVTYLMDGTKGFEVTLEASQGFAGRSFAFGGTSNVVCPPQAHCGSFECPDGYKHRPDSWYFKCAGEHCRNIVQDVELCCVLEEDLVDVSEVLMKKRMSRGSLVAAFADERRANGLNNEPAPAYRARFRTPELEAAWR